VDRNGLCLDERQLGYTPAADGGLGGGTLGPPARRLGLDSWSLAILAGSVTNRASKSRVSVSVATEIRRGSVAFLPGQSRDG
jgi:hypothetical protein